MEAISRASVVCTSCDDAVLLP